MLTLSPTLTPTEESTLLRTQPTPPSTGQPTRAPNQQTDSPTNVPSMLSPTPGREKDTKFRQPLGQPSQSPSTEQATKMPPSVSSSRDFNDGTIALITVGTLNAVLVFAGIFVFLVYRFTSSSSRPSASEIPIVSAVAVVSAPGGPPSQSEQQLQRAYTLGTNDTDLHQLVYKDQTRRDPAQVTFRRTTTR